MRKIIKYFDAAKQEALKSQEKRQMGAVIIIKNRIISRGRNFYKHPQAPKNFGFRGLHAEIHAIRNAKESLDGATIIVYGMNRKSGNELFSKPCSACQKHLISNGIKKVYFSTQEGYEVIQL